MATRPRRPVESFLLAACALLCCSACTGIAGSGFDVEVQLDAGLQGGIEVVSARGQQPGTSNPVDVEVVLRNGGSVARQLELDGRWQDARGGFQGGASDVRILQPGQQETFRAGTRSTRAARFRLTVRETTASADDLHTAVLADPTPKAAGHGITYTETPTLEEIPNWSPRGVANTAPFTAKTMLFRPDGDGWRMELSDRAFDPLQGTAMARQRHPDLQTVELELDAEPAAGRVLRREMDYGGGFFQIKLAPGADGTTSWNTALGWVIEFTAWERRPWVDGAGTFQDGGRASGRIYVAFRGSRHGGPQDSWISGTFTDVPIVYYGRP